MGSERDLANSIRARNSAQLTASKEKEKSQLDPVQPERFVFTSSALLLPFLFLFFCVSAAAIDLTGRRSG